MATKLYVFTEKEKILKAMPDFFRDGWPSKYTDDFNLPKFDLKLKENPNIVVVIGETKQWLRFENEELIPKYDLVDFEEILEEASPELKLALLFNMDLFL